MKKFIFSLVLLLLVSFCYAKTEHGYDAEKQYAAKDGGRYMIAVTEVLQPIPDLPEHKWLNIMEGYDKDNTQGFMVIIYFKTQEPALKNYKKLIKHYNNNNRSFDEFVDFFDNSEDFNSTIILNKEKNVPVYVYVQRIDE